VTGYKHYGIEVGQVYARADGTPGRLTVRDVLTFAEVDDVVVFDETQGEERRIDAFKLAKVQYYLVDFSSGDEKRELLRALRTGEARPDQQRLISQLFQAQATTLQEQQIHSRRGQFVVDHAEWRCLEDPREGKRTWLALRVAPDVDLCCKGFRAKALDEAIRAHDAT
jgi:ribosomal protein S28E/S33